MKHFAAGFFFASIVMLMLSCRKDSNLSPIPAIEFKSLLVASNGLIDTAAILSFTYADGDGDLGIVEENYTGPFNLKIATYEKVNGAFIYLINQDAYIPNLTPNSRDKSITGEITDILQLPVNVVSDTLHYEVYIVDRAGNQSNKIITPDIVVTTK